MSMVSLTRIVTADADRIWDVLTDLPARARWLCGLDAVEVLTPGPFATGTTWREYRTLPDGGSRTEEFRVAETVPPIRLVILSSGIGVEYRTTYTIRPATVRSARPVRIAPVTPSRHPARTAVSVVQQGVPTAAASRLVALVLGGFAARATAGALRRDLADLAAATEPPAGRSAPAA